jgi:hypothetical protein
MTSTDPRVRGAALFALAFAAMSPSPAWAQASPHSAADIAQARALFNKAKEQRDSGDTAGALEKFKAAHALGGTPLTGLELGRTYRILGLLVEARETFLAVARLPRVTEETSRSADARREAAALAEQLEARIPSVTIVVSGAKSGEFTVAIDDATVPSAALVAPRPLDPGWHTVVAMRGPLRAEARIELREGEAKTVQLRLPAPSAPIRPLPVREGSRSSAAGVIAATSLSVGGAGVVAGAITGALAFHDAAAVNAACQGTACLRSIDGDLRTGRALGTVSTVAFVFGGAGVASGILGLVVGRSRPAPREAAEVRAFIAPRNVGLGGTF